MKALVLAAGEGQRLRPLTNNVPKPMLKIGDRPILEHNIRLLAHHGVKDIIINLHHRPETITNYFGHGDDWGVNIQYSHEPKLLGTAGAAKHIETYFDGTFIVVYGDNLTTCNITNVLNTHTQKDSQGTIALFYRQNPLASGIVELNDEERIIRFKEKPSPDQVFSKWVNAGILVLETKVLEYIPDQGTSDFSRDIFPALLTANIPIYGYRMKEGLWWVDTPEDYNYVNALAENGGLDIP